MSNPYFTMRDACPVCGASKTARLYSAAYTSPPLSDFLQSFYAPVGPGIEFEYLDGANYTLDECLDCGLVFQVGVPNDALMHILYERWIDPQTVFQRHEKSDDLQLHAYYAKEIMQIIGYFNRSPSELKVFDFAMGWGKWARLAGAFGCQAYGAELAESRRQFARSNGIRIVDWDEIPKHRFDFINTEQVFEHIPDPTETLRRLAKALNPGGLIKISVPNGSDIKRRLKVMDWTAPSGSRNSLNAVSPLEHINCFHRRALFTLAQAAGLEPVFLPLSLQYAYSTNWKLVTPFLKNLLIPIYTSVLRRGTYQYFRGSTVMPSRLP